MIYNEDELKREILILNATVKAQTTYISDFKLELEAEYQRGRDSIFSRTCEGCKFGIFGIDSVGYEIECTKKWQCARAMPDKWEQK